MSVDTWIIFLPQSTCGFSVSTVPSDVSSAGLIPQCETAAVNVSPFSVKQGARRG